jgi:hypothetical protein
MISKSLIATAGLLALAVALNPVCGESHAMQNIKKGTWGGQGIILMVENDSGDVEYDCAHGKITGPLKVKSDGHFALNGTLIREHGGPIRQGEVEHREAVTYEGWTDGKKMTLRVTLIDSKDVIGEYELEYGRMGRVRKCR